MHMSKCVYCDSGFTLDGYEKGLALHLAEGFHEACLNQGEAEFPDDFQKRTGKTVGELLGMPLGEAIPFLKQGDGSPLSKLLPHRAFDDTLQMPRGADTLCATCHEYGACRDWVIGAAQDVCLELDLVEPGKILSYIAAKVFEGDYDHNTSITQIAQEFRADVLITTEV
jgi:hypothetical protein